MTSDSSKPSQPPAAGSANTAPDFGAKLQELEAITEWFESDEVDLNQALVKFERGMQLATELQQELGEVENRVEAIKAKFEATGQTAAGDAAAQAAPDSPAP